ncbi:hypothetical protein ACJJTC_000190 [Scirpophaga incertulas]
MRLKVIACVLLAFVCLSAGDVAHLKAKAKLVGRLLGKHHKRGIYSAVPPFKLGHDIPHVSHSVVKPFVVSYPPTATVAAVKVPVTPPYPHFPISVGHKGHHAHIGLKHHTKTVLVPKPDQHFHHHHHHVAPKPALPVLPAATAPLGPQPTATVVHPLRAPVPPLVIPAAAPVHEPIFPPQPIAPAPIPPPPLPVFPPHFPLRPLVPIAPVQPASAIAAPAFPLAPQFNYVIRPGNAVQTSFFASYPRYPLLNYQPPLVPLAAPPPVALPPAGPLLYDQPHVHQLVPQGSFHEGAIDNHPHGIAVEQPTLIQPTQAVAPQPAVRLQPEQPAIHFQTIQPNYIEPQGTVHLQPTPSAVPLDHDGWSPVPPQPHNVAHQPDDQFLDTHHFTQEQGTQVYEHHSGGEQQYNDYDHLHHHIQQQLDQAQYEHHLNQHQLNPEYGAPQQEYGQPNHDFAQHAHEYAHHVQEYAQHEQDYAQTHGQPGQEYGQPGQEYTQPGQEYGLPQGIEGRSSAEGQEEDTQRYHNHIPLGLQPPIDRPLEHFR